MHPDMKRRTLLRSLPALLAAPRLLAQEPGPPIHARGINHVTLSVSDLKRSVDFYQGLFGMPVASRQGTTHNLQIGAGPQFLALTAAASPPARIDHLCVGVYDFNIERIARSLAQRGIKSLNVREGAPGLSISDPNGFVIQLQDARYCGGGGPLGTMCAGAEPSPKRGLLAVRGWSHCTNTVADPAASRKFWQELFALRIQAYQGPAAPVFGIPGGVEFLMCTGGAAGRGGSGAAPRAAINHRCMTMENFRPDAVIKALESYGIKPRGGSEGTPPPLVHYISMRREDRGGAKEGTPELYFTDPDGLPIQLQDVSYCGGSGVLGNICI